MATAGLTRVAELHARCEAQRVTLSAHVSDIEERLERTDWALGKIRKLISRPVVLVGGIALILAVGRKGTWSKLTRAVALLVQARRLYSMLKQQ